MKHRLPIALLTLSFFAVQQCAKDISPPPDCTNSGVTIFVDSTGNTACTQSEGFIAVSASGGAGDFRFGLEDGPLQAGSTFENLAAGTYEVRAVDANGCAAAAGVTIQNKNGVNLATSSDASGCKLQNGSISLEAFDGVPPYVYKISGRNFQESPAFAHLASATYTATVRDSTGCEASRTVKVLSGTSFDAAIAPIIANNCAVNTCHNGNQFPDLRVFKNVQDNATNIKSLTQSRTMPQEGSLAQSEIDAIACWVDDGALDN